MAADLEDGRSLREDIGSFLGIRRPTTGPEVRTLASWQDDGYVRHLVHLVTDDDTIPALLAVPPGVGPFPGVVVLHQHAGQRHLGKSEVFGLAGDPHQAFGPALARAGFVVVAPDSIAFEDRRPAGQAPTPATTTGTSTTTRSRTASSPATRSCARSSRTRWRPSPSSSTDQT